MDILYSVTEAEGEKEEGELMQDEPEQQPDDLASDEGRHGFSILEGVGSGDEGDDAVEIASPNNEQGAHDFADVSMLNDADDIIEDSEKRSTSSIDQAAPLSEQSVEISQQNLASGQLIPSASTATGADSQPKRSSRTISISEMARRKAQLRQAGLATQQQQQQQQKSASRG